jgi:hypothetical protein
MASSSYVNTSFERTALTARGCDYATNEQGRALADEHAPTVPENRFLSIINAAHDAEDERKPCAARLKGRAMETTVPDAASALASSKSTTGTGGLRTSVLRSAYRNNRRAENVYPKLGAALVPDLSISSSSVRTNVPRRPCTPASTFNPVSQSKLPKSNAV